MKLSILDQAVVSHGTSAGEALKNVLDLAVFADQAGFHRFWLAEHHAMTGFASSAPEVTLSAIGQVTKSIRLGSGATLLPYYKPFKVAEVYHTLATLYPGRVDLGIGRAPGGPAEASEALSEGYLQAALNMPTLTEELSDYIHQDNIDSKLKLSPISEEKPEIWMLGTSEKSALSAARLGLNYCFGQFMSNAGETDEVLNAYHSHFLGENPHVMMTVTVFCADSAEQAHDIAMSSLIWGIMKEREFGESKNNDGLPSIEEAKAFKLTTEEHEKLEERKKSMIIGTPETVGETLQNMVEGTQIQEIMISTNTYSLKDKIHSFKLVKEYFDY
jgi:luciferase family oxidoreductase group 1